MIFFDYILGRLRKKDASGGSGAVDSVFGRSGNVVAQSGDYNYTQITGLQAELDSKVNNTAKAISSTQWNTTIPTPVPLSTGDIANGCTFFDPVADKSTAGTTSYDEYDIAYGLSIILDTGNSTGTLRVTIKGSNYTLTFSNNNYDSAVNFVNANKTALNAVGVRLFALGSGTDGRVRFCSDETTLNGITITNTSGDITGVLQNEFTNSATAVGDHILIPYAGKPYENTRIFHTIRTNFEVQNGSVAYAELGLYRYEDDSRIGSAKLITRNQDVTGNLVVIETYTASATDPFVIGGFYLALFNDSGTTFTFENKAGILIQNVFERSFDFP